MKAGAGVASITLLPLMASKKKSLNKSGAGVLKIVRNGDGKQVNVIGDKMTFKLTGEDTNGDFVLIEQNNAPGTGIPVHIHENEDEIFRVIEGKLEVQVADEITVLEAGDISFLPKGIPHTWKVVGDTYAKVDLSFYPAGLEEMFVELSNLPEGPPDMDVVFSICARYGISFLK